MENWFIAKCAITLLFTISSNAQDIKAEMKSKLLDDCSRFYGQWRLMSITFLPHKTDIEENEVILRKVVLSQKYGGTRSTSEISIKHTFKGHTQYIYTNGTQIYPQIPDAGKVPRIIDGKVTNLMESKKGGYLYGKYETTEELDTKFTCNSAEDQNVHCVVVLKAKKYKVPFTALVRGDGQTRICVSRGIWEKLGDPMLEFVTEIKNEQ